MRFTHSFLSRVGLRGPTSGLLWLVWASAQAQGADPRASAVEPVMPSPAPTTIVVTGNPLGNERVAAPVSVLAGDALVLRRGATLGESLDGLPGVSATYFGPNASRPVVRGLEGDRVRVLANAGASLDASALSFDHALPIDPLIVSRVEVLRGPAALLYGASALGGVVNVIDNRVPADRLTALAGAAELRLGGAARERGGAALLEGGGAGSLPLAWHVDVFARDTADLRVPRHTPEADGASLAPTQHVRNSSARTQGGAVGGTLFVGTGRIGLAVDRYDSHYGVVAEPDVTIDMKRDRLSLAGEFKALGAIAALRLNANASDYRHEEVEGDGTVGTRFKNRGQDLRLEAEHAPIGALRGVWGLQLERSDFSALGEEAFVPTTRTRKAGVFALEQWDAGRAGQLSAGLRLERVQVDSDGDADPAQTKFGAAVQRRFDLSSVSLSQLLPLARGWSFALALSASERAPTYFELYANGVHAATGAFERGAADLAKERGANVDAALQWQSGADHLRVGAFATRFGRFIVLDASGEEVDDTGAVVPAGTAGAVPLYAFRAVRARLAGLEVEGRKRLVERPWTLDVTVKFDATRGRNVDTGEPLPRIAPRRFNLGLELAGGPWTSRLELDRAERQSHVPATDRPTAGYTLVNLSLARRVDLGRSDALWFLKAGNVTDRLAFSASSIATIRGLSPLPGRALSTGLRVAF